MGHGLLKTVINNKKPLVKGDIIQIPSIKNTVNTFRVLNVIDQPTNTVELVGLTSIGDTVFDSTKTASDYGSGWGNGSTLSGHELDEALNTTYYNMLPQKIKDNILPQDISQDMLSADWTTDGLIEMGLDLPAKQTAAFTHEFTMDNISTAIGGWHDVDDSTGAPSYTNVVAEMFIYFDGVQKVHCPYNQGNDPEVNFGWGTEAREIYPEEEATMGMEQPFRVCKMYWPMKKAELDFNNPGFIKYKLDDERYFVESNSSRTSACYLGKKPGGVLNVGSRNIYPLGVADIFNYLGTTHPMTIADTTMTGKNVLSMINNSTDSGESKIWLRSSKNTDAFYIGTDGLVRSAATDTTCGVNPVFTVKLKNVSFKVQRLTLKFNAMGGECEIESKKCKRGKAVGELPLPSKAGYEFGGWFTEKNGEGTKITETSIMGESDTKVFAYWI